MNKRTEHEIRNRFDELASTGMTIFNDKWLLRSFNARRMGKNNVWGALFAFLPEDVAREDLWLFRTGGQTFVLHHDKMTDLEAYMDGPEDAEPAD